MTKKPTVRDIEGDVIHFDVERDDFDDDQAVLDGGQADAAAVAIRFNPQAALDELVRIQQRANMDRARGIAAAGGLRRRNQFEL